MKQFFKIFFATLLAFITGIVLLVFIFFGIVSLIIAGAGDKKVTVKNNSILEIHLPDPVSERSSSNPFRNFDLNSMKPHNQPGMNDILKCIKNAAKDDRIKGIYINATVYNSGLSNTEELRNALLEFKKSKKFVYAYADYYSQGSYYLASVADKIYVNPQGAVELKGLMTQLLFFKGTFEKLDIQPTLIKHGKYKSAGETFVRESMSEENRMQIAAFVDDIWNNMALQIASSRSLQTADVNDIADSLMVRSAHDALRYKLVDRVSYYDEFISDVNRITGNDKNEKLETITLSRYRQADLPVKEKFTTDRIAVIYASGSIGSGDGDEETIGSDKIAQAIRKARLDKDVKGIVMRVNSPGGSALASEVIWREALLASKEKPLAVSMSDVAASGGYYISCGAERIFANPNTITGSIGVFGLLLNAEPMLKNKLGITVDGYKTGEFTDLGLPTGPVSKAEEMIVQQMVDSIYITFAHRVSDARKMKIEMVDSLGQGRVWSGVDALSNGLIDQHGGLYDAIHYVAGRAEIDNYRLRELPEQKDPFETLLEDFSAGAMAFLEGSNQTEHAIYIRTLKKLREYTGVQMRMEWDIELN